MRTAYSWHNALGPKGPAVGVGARAWPAAELIAGGAVSVPFILAPGEKHPDAPPLDRPFFRFASGQTGGLATLAEVQLPPLTAGPNLHVHTREDELFFVLDGVMTVQVGEQLQEITAGGLAWGARGTPHAFANRAKDPLRIMIMWIPGGAEGLFLDMREYLQTAGGAPDPQVVADLQARYGATHVGPPIPIPGS
jgi:mannose-6-phosphate isomerase-like protein (cupin superfamily)